MQGLIDEAFTLTKLRETFASKEMEEDLTLNPAPKYIVLASTMGNIINLDSPIGQFILILGIFIILLKFVKVKRE